MNLKVIHAHSRANGVELSRAIIALDARQKLPLNLLTTGAAIGRQLIGADNVVADFIHGSIFHAGFKTILWILGMEVGESGLQPRWGGRL